MSSAFLLNSNISFEFLSSFCSSFLILIITEIKAKINNKKNELFQNRNNNEYERKFLR